MRTRSHARRAAPESALDADLRARVLGGLALPDLLRVGAVSRGFRQASGEAVRGLTGREPMVCGGFSDQRGRCHRRVLVAAAGHAAVAPAPAAAAASLRGFVRDAGRRDDDVHRRQRQ